MVFSVFYEHVIFIFPVYLLIKMFSIFLGFLLVSLSYMLKILFNLLFTIVDWETCFDHFFDYSLNSPLWKFCKLLNHLRLYILSRSCLSHYSAIIQVYRTTLSTQVFQSASWFNIFYFQNLSLFICTCTSTTPDSVTRKLIFFILYS